MQLFTVTVSCKMMFKNVINYKVANTVFNCKHDAVIKLKLMFMNLEDS